MPKATLLNGEKVGVICVFLAFLKFSSLSNIRQELQLPTSHFYFHVGRRHSILHAILSEGSFV